MESRLIYSVVNSGKLDLEWQKDSETEWIYIGVNDELKKEFLNKIPYCQIPGTHILGRSFTVRMQTANKKYFVFA